MPNRKRAETSNGASEADAGEGLADPSSGPVAGPDFPEPDSEDGPAPPRGSVAAEATSGPEAPRLIERAKTSCLMNARYHASREAFLDTVHRWFMFGIIAFGAGALIDIFGPANTAKGGGGANELVKAAFAAGSALLGALDLTFDLSNRARTHALMKRRYLELLADLTAGTQHIIGYEAEIHRIGADEEPVFFALLCSCWNAAQKSVYGHDALLFRIPRHHLVLRNVFRFSAAEYGPPERAAGRGS
jgi:hypothetical protein